MFYSLFFKLYDQFFYVLIKTTWTTWDILDVSLLPLNNGLNKCSLFESVAFFDLKVQSVTQILRLGIKKIKIFCSALDFS